MRITPYTKRFFCCIACNDHEFAVEHVMGSAGKSYRWVCDCGASNAFVVWEDGTISVELAKDQRREPRLAVVRLQHTTCPIYLLLETSVDPKESAEDQAEHAQYYFEEHTCPTNPEIEAWIVVQSPDSVDPDPHGIFEFVGFVPALKKNDATGTTHEALRHIELTNPEMFSRLFGVGINA